MNSDNKKGGRKKEIGGYNSTFDVRLRNLMSDTKTTQPQLAEAIGVSRQAVGQWKDGNTVPDILDLHKISAYFGVSCDYLVGRTNAKSINPEIQIIMDYTGLSEEAIQTLNYNIKHDIFHKDEISAILSTLLSTGQFYVLLRYISDYLRQQRGFEASYSLLNTFLKSSWEGFFDEIPVDEQQTIIETTKEFVSFFYGRIYEAPEKRNQPVADYCSSVFEAMKDNLSDNADLLGFRISKHFQDLISGITSTQRFTINEAMQTFEQTLRDSNLSDNTVRKIMKEINNYQKKREKEG